MSGAAEGARIRFGTSSWSAKSWVGSFYPQKAKPADFLGLYSKCFDTVDPHQAIELWRAWGASPSLEGSGTLL